MRLARSVGLLALPMALGCGGSPAPEQVVPIDQVPPAVLAKAREKLPGFTFTAAYRKTEDGREVIEVRGKNKKGQIREAEFTPDGQFLAVE